MQNWLGTWNGMGNLAYMQDVRLISGIAIWLDVDLENLAHVRARTMASDSSRGPLTEVYLATLASY